MEHDFDGERKNRSKTTPKPSTFSSSVVIFSSIIVCGLLLISFYNLVVAPSPTYKFPSWTQPTGAVTTDVDSSLYAGQTNTYKRLKTLGFAPKVALDIGPSDSQWGHLVRKVLDVSNTYLIGITQHVPTFAIQPDLTSITADASALKAARRIRARLGGGGFAPKANEEVSSYTLDDLYTGNPPAALVRFHATEDATTLLDGASEILKHAEVVVVELDILDGVANSKTRPLELFSYLNKMGYRLFDIAEYLKFFGTEYSASIDHVTVIFVQKSSPLTKALLKAVNIIP
jgi:hypothetical protein